MLISKEDIKKSVKENEHAKRYFQNIMKELNSFNYNEILKLIKEQKDLYKACFILLKMSFYHFITEDEKYVSKIREFALSFCNAPKWSNQGARNGWISDLLTGDLSFCFSLSFYLTKGLFTKSEQNLIKESLMHKGFYPLYNEWINPDTRIHSLDTMGHNWWTVCVCGLGGLVLTMDDDTPNKQKYLNEIVDSLKKWLSYRGNRYLNKHTNFGKEGDYIEYAGYMLYGLSNFTPFEELYRRATGDNSLLELSPLNKTANYLISCLDKIDGKYKFPKISDTKDENGYRHSLLYMAHYYNRGDLLDIYENILYDSCSAYDLLFFEKLKVKQKPVSFEPLTIYSDTGYAFMHDEDDFMVAIKAGETGCHNHRDNGTFTISYKGKELIIDSGTCPYGMKEYLSYFCAPSAHNVITFEGKGIREDGMYGGGVAAMGEIASYINEPDFKYILADCTKPYLNILQKNFRHIIKLNGVMFIIDDIYAEKDGYAEFLLHHAGKATINENIIEIQNENAKVDVISIMPSEKEILEKQGYLYKKELTEAKYFSIKGRTKNKRLKFITAFVFDDKIKINQHTKQDILELNINRSGINERLIFNFVVDKKDVFNNAHIIYDNIRTNAFITYIKEKEDNMLESAIINGFYLYHNNKKVYLSLTNDDKYIK